MPEPVEALYVRDAGEVVEVVADALLQLTWDPPDGVGQAVTWTRSPVPAEGFPRHESPWSHLRFAIGVPSTRWALPEGGQRRRRGGTVQTEVVVRWLWGLRIDDGPAQYTAMLLAERRAVDAILARAARAGVRITIERAERSMQTQGAEGSVSAWVVGTLRLRADHRYARER